MFSSKWEHLMGESQSRYKQYHYLRGIRTHLCPQLRASVPARSLGSCGALTRVTNLPSVTFDARGRIHHVVGRLADKQAGPMGACVCVCRLSNSWVEELKSGGACRCESGSDRRYRRTHVCFSTSPGGKRRPLI